VLEGFRVEARYLKIRAVCDRRTNYQFCNHLSRMVPTFAAPRLEGTPYYELEDPIFAALCGDVPAQRRVLYWSGNCDDELGRLRPWFRAYAKKFGHRYVFEEQLEEAAEHKLVCSGKRRPELDAHGIDTWRNIIGDPGEAIVPSVDSMPMVFGTQGWMMDPRWQREYVRRAVARAKANEQWALWAGDETWEGHAISVVPNDKRYQEVIQADQEIREQYGFGKYGMPESNEDADPFARIAHRRWVSDRLTELFKKTREEVKEVNPHTAMLAPDFASGVPAADIEAWAPHFDVFSAQCWPAPTPFLAQVCVGCDTKALVDLSGKPVWMAVQNATQPDRGFTITPEFVREIYSQVFRNGGHGIFVLASEWWERELNHPRFAEPAKWRAMLHAIDTVTSMNLPRPPKPDCAILYSSDSLLTLRWAQMTNGDWELYSAYAALGPLLRSWFDFVSDRQIERGIRDLRDYRVLYVPFAEYERRPVFEKIASYVEEGGTVVCTDPDAFTWDLTGESLAEEWQKLTGVRRAGPRKTQLAMKTLVPSPLPLEGPLHLAPSLVSGWEVELVSKEVKTLAAFEDGAPGITMGRYGRGKVIYFAADPFAVPGGVRARRSLVEPSAPIVNFIEAVQKDSGAAMGHDIWRFKLPPFPSDDLYRKEEGLCLTGNYVYDRNEPLLEANNAQTGGTYTYSRPPTGLADAAEGGEPIPFDRGHLTSRLAAYQSRQLGGHMDYKKLPEVPRKWIVSWTDRAPLSVTFDLTAGHALKKLRLFYSGTMPALEVSGSLDGEAWSRIASSPEDNAGADVKDAALPLSGTYRDLKLGFAARKTGKTFELAEVEIWGHEAID